MGEHFWKSYAALLKRIPEVLDEIPAPVGSGDVRSYRSSAHDDLTQVFFAAGAGLKRARADADQADRAQSQAAQRESIHQRGRNRFSPCVRCAKRLSYKPDYKQGIRPVAVLLHSAERYDWRGYFSDPLADDYYRRMLAKSMGIPDSELHHLELVGCNFADNDDFEKRRLACANFVDEYISENAIRAVLVIGPAALAYWPEETARSLAHQWQTEAYKAPNATLPGMILRSPESLVWLDRKGRAAEKKELALEFDRALREAGRQLRAMGV